MQRTLRQPGFWLAVGLVGISVVCQIALSVPLQILDVVLRGQGKAVLNLISDPLVLGIVNLISFGLAITVGLLVNRLWPRRAFPLGQISLGAWLALVLSVLGAGALLSEVDNFVRLIFPPPAWVADLMRDIFLADDRFGSMFFSVVLVAALTEEFLFRGIILRGFLARFRPWTAVMLTAMLFALMHMNPWQLLPAFGLGVLFGWFYLRTGSLWPCIAGHALNNFLSLIVMNAPFGLWEPLKVEDMSVIEFQPWWMDLIGAGLLVLGIWLFRKSSPATPAAPDEPLPPVLPASDASPVIPA